MSKNQKISIISPVFQAEPIIELLVKKVCKETEKITNNYEIILVEDGSSDDSWSKIKSISLTNKSIKGVKLSKNFGQHYAITAGLKESSGNYVIVMDCDLQDDPKYFHKLFKKIEEGYDLVLTKKINRKHGYFKNLLAHMFHRIFNWLKNENATFSNPNIGAFSILNRKVVNAFCQHNEFHRSYLNIIQTLGFKTTVIKIEHLNRYSGKTTYGFKKSISLAIDTIVSYSDRLLKVSIFTGLIFSIFGFLLTIFIIFKAITIGFRPGWASIIVSIIFCTGLILLSLGILGVYISKIFIQSKNRPLYLIDKKTY